MAQAAGDCVYGAIEELAAAEKINPSYVSRILRMTLPAPDIVEAIRNGTHIPDVTLATLMRPFSADWMRKRTFWESASKDSLNKSSSGSWFC
jgi:hypothetical protein